VEDVAVVGYGALLPDADGPDAFWHNLLTGHCAIREVSPEIWEKRLYFSADPRASDKSGSPFAGFLDEAAIGRAARALGVERDRHSRLQIMTLAAAEQAFAPLAPQRPAPGRAALYLGCMAVDDGVSRKKFFADEWESLRAHVASACPAAAHRILPVLRERLGGWAFDPERDRPSLFPSSVLPLLQQRFALDGEAALVDAACASSLAAIDLAMRALHGGRADLAVTGGIDASLGPGSFVLFSRLGALASERCLPLDRHSEGLSQGEGAVILILERLGDANRLGHAVHGILKGCGASSDGRSSSLFAPTTGGQLRAYRQAYGDLDPRTVDYVECHATGTTVGDETELRSVIRFFGDRRLPIGSVKAQVGHTKGAAGAVSLLKCLLSLKHRTLTPAPYFRDSILREPHGPFVNREPIRLRQRGGPLTFGISSFGFGGINYHLVLQEAPRARSRRAIPRRVGPEPDVSTREIVLIGRKHRKARDCQTEMGSLLRIPNRSLDQIDAVQLTALAATSDAARALRLDFGRLETGAVSVISASTLGLDRAYALSNRVLYGELEPPLVQFGEEIAAKVMAHKAHHPPVTEDTGPGMLNNVIAGRVAHHFDLTGPSCNIDADLASFPAALRTAELWLSTRDGLVILLAVDEAYDAERFRVERAGVTCWLLASLSFAKTHDLPIEALLGRLVRAPREPLPCN